MHSPLVSVIIPTYNRSSLISRTIENVFEQTYKNIEVIVVDDGSTDDTLIVLGSFGSRIRVVSQANRGPAAARNRGIEVAQGEIIAFQDSADLWLPSKLDRQVALLVRSGESVPCCLCNARMHFMGRPATTSFELAPIYPKLEEGAWTNVAEVLVTRSVLFNQCAAIRKNALVKVGGFNESLRILEDYDLSLRLALEGDSWALIRDPLVIWRQGAPESLWLKARQDKVWVRECTLKCLEVFDAKVQATERYSRLKRLSCREVERRRRDLSIARMERMQFVGASALSGLLKRGERYLRGLRRRTPWYPTVAMEPCGRDYSCPQDLAHRTGGPAVG